MQTYGQIFDALGDPTRRVILDVLKRGPRPVGQLASKLPVSRPAVSQHLKVLKEAGLVSERKNGAQRIYGLDQRGLVAVRAYLDSFWDAALFNLKAYAELTRPKRSQRKS